MTTIAFNTPQWDASGILIFGGIALGALVLAWALTWWVWRSPPALEPHEYAFRALARRFGLSGRQKTLVRRLARTINTDPVALLISHEAFTRAAHRDKQVTSTDATAVETRVFRSKRRLQNLFRGG